MDGAKRMSIFKRTKSRAAAVPEGVFTESERERDALWRLTALPRDGFDATYGVLLERCWRHVAAPRLLVMSAPLKSTSAWRASMRGNGSALW